MATTVVERWAQRRWNTETAIPQLAIRAGDHAPPFLVAVRASHAVSRIPAMQFYSVGPARAKASAVKTKRRIGSGKENGKWRAEKKEELCCACLSCSWRSKHRANVSIMALMPRLERSYCQVSTLVRKGDANTNIKDSTRAHTQEHHT